MKPVLASTDLSAEQVKAGRALLAWSQRELASRARVSVSTIADFERGSRTPVANNAQAIRDALEGNGLKFLAGGVERQRLVLSAGMIACHGRVQREGEVIHVVTDHLEDLSDLLRGVGERDEPFPIVHGRGDGATHPSGRDPRTGAGAALDGASARIYIPDLRLGSGIKVPTRDFR